jgi:peptidoglycan/xylan/chitin deacetylase (PgdA/CDA1 family)
MRLNLHVRLYTLALALLSGASARAAAEHTYAAGGMTARVGEVVPAVVRREAVEHPRLFAGPLEAASVWAMPLRAPPDVGGPRRPLTALLSASRSDLEAALWAMGFDEGAPVCDPAATDAVLLDGQWPGFFGAAWDADAYRLVRLAAWRVERVAGGAGPVWAVAAWGEDHAHEAAARSVGVCSDLTSQVVSGLRAGLSHTRASVPLTPATRSVPWIDLRHAAGALALLTLPYAEALCDAEAPAPVCAVPARMPPPVMPAPTVVETLIWRDNTEPSRVALTFDACSTFTHGEYNAAVIDALIAHTIPATLFIGGHWAEMHPQEVRRLAAHPLFEIANHSYSHPHMVELPPAQQRQELLWTQQILFSLTGKLPRYFRPPYGEIDDAVIRAVAEAGLYTVEFDLPAGDATYEVSTARLTEWIVRKARPGSIVVMHMNRPGNKTAPVLPEIARTLRARGYTFGQVGDLLGISAMGPSSSLFPVREEGR